MIEKLSLYNNQLYCSRCMEEYSLLKENENDIGKCTKIPLLYDNDLSDYYYFYHYYQDFYRIYVNNKLDYIYKYEEDYSYFIDYNNYPCQESTNLGTKEKPIYSCTKCYNIFENEKVNYYSYEYTRIINKRNNVSFCIYQYREDELLENCTEAVDVTKDGIEKYDCLKCIDDENKLIYDFDAKINYCKYGNVAKKCMVKYCKICKSNNNYFCDECLLSNYEVNPLTGEREEKSETVPAITFKDIFRLEMNSEKVVNGQTIYGPSLRLRGITSSQINTRNCIFYLFNIQN